MFMETYSLGGVATCHACLMCVVFAIGVDEIYLASVHVQLPTELLSLSANTRINRSRCEAHPDADVVDTAILEVDLPIIGRW